MKLDLEKVQAIIDGAVTYDCIVKETGISKGVIYPYRTRKRPIANMTIRTALKLQELYDEKEAKEKQNQGGNKKCIIKISQK